MHRPVCQLLQFGVGDVVAHSDISIAFEELKVLQKSLGLSSTMQQLSLQHENEFAISDTNGYDGLEKTVAAFCRKAEYIHTNLGSWAADYFIGWTIGALRNDDEATSLFNATGTTRQHLLALLFRFPMRGLCQDRVDPSDSTTSSKVKCLISFLLEDPLESSTGIVFVEQRATTSVLSALLQRHPAIKNKFRSVPFVGTSNVRSRRYSLTELLDLKAQKEAIKKFRAGDHNLIVSTNALEEGIDVQSCNMVVCFDPPANAKSFIQRRGRARHVRSRLAILVHADKDQQMLSRWQSLEEELSRICQEDRARIAHVQNIEDPSEEMNYQLSVPSSGYVSCLYSF